MVISKSLSAISSLVLSSLYAFDNKASLLYSICVNSAELPYPGRTNMAYLLAFGDVEDHHLVPIKSQLDESGVV
ncbi:MAG: hypothetical protein WCK71_02610, partial [bacterium]